MANDISINDIPITEARHKLTNLPKYFSREPGAVTVTRRGKPVLAILPWELYESIMETLEVMGDPELMGVLRHDIREIKERKKSKEVPWEEVKRQLNL